MTSPPWSAKGSTQRRARRTYSVDQGCVMLSRLESNDISHLVGEDFDAEAREAYVQRRPRWRYVWRAAIAVILVCAAMVVSIASLHFGRMWIGAKIRNGVGVELVETTPSSTVKPSFVYRRVFVFRHCLRSTPTKPTHTGTPYKKGEDFTNQSLPDWNTPEKWCTEGGLDIIKSLGRALAVKYDLASSTFKIVSDTDMRDGQTALGLRDGIFEGAVKSVVYDPLAFDTHGVCSDPAVAVQEEELNYILANSPAPMGVGLPNSTSFSSDYAIALNKLQSIIGQGKAGPLARYNNPPIIVETKPGRAGVSGSVNIMKFFAQQMMYSWGSGIQTYSATAKQIYSFMPWVYYQRHVNQAPISLVTKGAGFITSMLKDLNGGIPANTNSFYVGHDTDHDISKVVFGINWKAPPYDSPYGPTPPGSALVFTMHDDSTVNMEFVYQVFDGTSDPPLKYVPTEPPSMTSHQFNKKVTSLLQRYPSVRACVNSLKGRVGSGAN